jgi:hypothetical protein
MACALMQSFSYKLLNYTLYFSIPTLRLGIRLVVEAAGVFPERAVQSRNLACCEADLVDMLKRLNESLEFH